MFYFPLKYMARIALGINFKNIYFSNYENLPKGKPVLLVSNHPTAFIEPCIFGAYLPRRVHWLVRGDLFKKPLYRKLMNDINMIPIFRKIDVEGINNVEQNYGTFKYVHELLSKNQMVHILAEGSTKQVKKARPLKKGTSRMAFGTLEEYGKDIDIHLVPCGMNYTQADKFRSDLLISIGQPFRIQDYLSLYEENENKAYRKLTNDLTKAMRQHIITIEDEENTDLYEHIFELNRNKSLRRIFPIYDTSENLKFEKEFEVCEKVNALSDDERSNLFEKTSAYFSALTANGINDFGVAQSSFGNLGKIPILILGFIPFLIGRIATFIPAYFAKSISKNKVKQLEFKASVALALGIGFYFLMAIVLIVAAIVIQQWWFWVLVVIIPFLGYYSLIYEEFYKDWNMARKFKTLDANQQEKLNTQRQEIFSSLGELSEPLLSVS